jgi:hypothetical protein
VVEIAELVDENAQVSVNCRTERGGIREPWECPVKKSCPHCGTLNDPIETVGYCDSCGKKLPGLNLDIGPSTLERRRERDAEDGAITAPAHPWNAPAILLSLVALLQLGLCVFRFLDVDRQAQANVQSSDFGPDQYHAIFRDIARRETRVRVVICALLLALAFYARRFPLRAAGLAAGGYALFTLGWLGGLGPWWLLWDSLFEAVFAFLLLGALAFAILTSVRNSRRENKQRGANHAG